MSGSVFLVKTAPVLGKAAHSQPNYSTYRAGPPNGPTPMRTLDRLAKTALSWIERHLPGLSAYRASPRLEQNGTYRACLRLGPTSAPHGLGRLPGLAAYSPIAYSPIGPVRLPGNLAGF